MQMGEMIRMTSWALFRSDWFILFPLHRRGSLLSCLLQWQCAAGSTRGRAAGTNEKGSRLV